MCLYETFKWISSWWSWNNFWTAITGFATVYVGYQAYNLQQKQHAYIENRESVLKRIEFERGDVEESNCRGIALQDIIINDIHGTHVNTILKGNICHAVIQTASFGGIARVDYDGSRHVEIPASRGWNRIMVSKDINGNTIKKTSQPFKTKIEAIEDIEKELSLKFDDSLM